MNRDAIRRARCALDKSRDFMVIFVDIDLQHVALRLVNASAIMVTVIKIAGNILNSKKHEKPQSLEQNGERRRIRARAAQFKRLVLLNAAFYTSPWMKRLTPTCRHREDPALDAGDVAIQSPSFQQEDWIAALPTVARNDEGGATRESRHWAVGLTPTNRRVP